MNRLTTDNPLSNTEKMLNLAYAKDGWVCVRDIGKPFMDYMREQCGRTGCNLRELDDYELLDAIFECVFSNPKCPMFLLNIIATQAAKLRERLKEYEDIGLTPDEVAGLAEAK